MGRSDGVADMTEETKARPDVQRVIVAVAIDPIPATYSIVKYGSPSSVRPPSKSCAMPGCESLARICRSATKRARWRPSSGL